MGIKARTLFGWGIPFLIGGASLAADSSDLRLVDAAKNRDRAAVRALLKQRVDVNAPQPDGATALHWAAHWDDLELTDLLIGAGAHVNTANELGVTPLSLACTNGNAAIVAKLLQAGANSNAVTPTTGETVLMTAARTGKAEVITALLAAGSDVNVKEPRQGQTALMWAVAERHAAVARTLLEHGADVRARSTAGFTSLMFAARHGDLEIVRLLLAAGANVNETAADGSTPLLIATVRGHTTLAAFLLEQGADPNADSAGFTVLHWAAGSWEASVSGMFGVAAPSHEEWGALSGLQGRPKLEFVKLLLARGANPNARLAKNPPRFGHGLFTLKLVGGTPFFVAALAGDVAVMRVLVDAGADPWLSTAENTTPLMAAAGIGWVPGESRVTEASAFEAVKLTAQLGGDVNAVNANGYTALHGASLMGANPIVQFLVENGAKVNVKNKRGETPLMIAEGKGVRVAGTNILHESTANLLRRLGANTQENN